MCLTMLAGVSLFQILLGEAFLLAVAFAVPSPSCLTMDCTSTPPSTFSVPPTRSTAAWVMPRLDLAILAVSAAPATVRSAVCTLASVVATPWVFTFTSPLIREVPMLVSKSVPA